MIKMKTLYQKDQNDLSRVTDKLDLDCMWVFDKGVKAYRKLDGTSCAIFDGVLYKRYDNKKNKSLPEGAIECQKADVFSGHHPYWIPCDRKDKSNKYHFEAFDYMNEKVRLDGTYELIGTRINKNPEKVIGHLLVKHDSHNIEFSFAEKKWMLGSIENLKTFLKVKDIEGIVFHHPDGRMCKIRKKDFGYRRVNI